MLKILFIVFALLFFFALLFGKLFVFGKKNPTFVGRYAATTAALIIFYCILGLVLMPKAGSIDRLILLACAASPFIIGRLTTHKTVSLFTFLQLIVVGYSVIFAIYFL